VVGWRRASGAADGRFVPIAGCWLGQPVRQAARKSAYTIFAQYSL